MKMRNIKSKKADSSWISWVLLMAFAVVMSAVVYNWMFGFTKSSATSMEQRSMNAAECEQVGISVDYVCQDAQSLYIDFTNRNNLNIDKVIVRMYNIYGEPIQPLFEKRIALNPKESGTVQVPKTGAIKRVDVIPETIQKNVEVMCTEMAAKAEQIEFKDNCK